MPISVEGIKPLQLTLLNKPFKHQLLISCLDTPQHYGSNNEASFKPSYLQTELALQLCWAVGEHGGGGSSHKDAARELFETLELLLYENLASRYLQIKKISSTKIMLK